MSTELNTERLVLRQWRDSDREPFATMNADALVMRHFPRRYSAAESNAFVDDNVRRIAERGWGNWAVELRGSGEFIGFVGLSEPAPWHPCAGSIEIGWRLDRRHWRRGHATEAARRALDVGFGTLGLEEIVSFTASCNLPSVSVMRRIGMLRDDVGFEHPRIEVGSPVRSHVVHRLTRHRWERDGRRVDA